MAVGAAMRGSVCVFGAAAANRLSPSLAAAFCGRCADDAGADDAAYESRMSDKNSTGGAKTKNKTRMRMRIAVFNLVLKKQLKMVLDSNFAFAFVLFCFFAFAFLKLNHYSSSS